LTLSENAEAHGLETSLKIAVFYSRQCWGVAM